MEVIHLKSAVCPLWVNPRENYKNFARGLSFAPAGPILAPPPPGFEGVEFSSVEQRDSNVKAKGMWRTSDRKARRDGPLLAVAST